MRSAEHRDIPEPIRRKLELSRRFIAGDLTGREFERAFLDARSEALSIRHPPGWNDAMQQIFYFIDDFVADPGPREDPRELDEEQLREAVRLQVARIDEGRGDEPTY